MRCAHTSPWVRFVHPIQATQSHCRWRSWRCTRVRSVWPLPLLMALHVAVQALRQVLPWRWQPCGVGALVVAREAPDGFGVALDGARGQASHLRGIDHALEQWAHDSSPEWPGNIPLTSGCACQSLFATCTTMKNAVAALAYQPPRQRFSSMDNLGSIYQAPSCIP